MYSKFQSVDSVYHFLVGRTPQPTVTVVESPAKKAKEPSKQKAVRATASAAADGETQVLVKGRVRYGPITVNPRKQPSKTLFTGRRSKYELLEGDEEEKRRDRRERNRVAATKCREKRENVLSNLETEHTHEVKSNKRLMQLVAQLEQRKSELEKVIEEHLNECLLSNNTAMIFGDPSFLASIPDTPALPLPNSPAPIVFSDQEEEEISQLLNPILTLTNSAYNEGEINPPLLPQSMTTSSIDRLFNTLHTPNISMESCQNSLALVNTAHGTSCAKQHSHSSEEGSLPKCANPYVC